MSKGSNRRPTQVSSKQFDDNWDRIFAEAHQADLRARPKGKEKKIIDEFKAKKRKVGQFHPTPEDKV